VDPRVYELVEAADLNGLLRAVDGMCSSREWDDLLELADVCVDAAERGKQLWPIAAHIDYRVALEAPPRHVGEVIESDLKRFTLGPLTEVAASTHTWDELAPHLGTPQAAAYVAQERVLRGEDLDDDPRCHPEVLELPLHVEGWEPVYTLARFAPDHVEVAEPWEPRTMMESAATRAAKEIDDAELTDALLDLVQPWTTESNGAARAVVVEGDAVGAASGLTFGSLSIGELSHEEALQRMAWAAASGGAHGRRRGAAFGRFAAWYATAVLGGLEWPAEPGDIARAASGLRWYRWDEGEVEEGWVLRLAVEHPADGWGAAIAATDLLEDDEDLTD
jgi:hypothetical protein